MLSRRRGRTVPASYSSTRSTRSRRVEPESGTTTGGPASPIPCLNAWTVSNGAKVLSLSPPVTIPQGLIPRWCAPAASTVISPSRCPTFRRWLRQARRVARTASRALDLADLLDAVRGGEPELPANVRRLVAHHEAGHAIALLALGIAE